MERVDAARWRLCILSVEPLAVDLGVCAARHNVALTGIHHTEHHLALLASLRVGCNAYATSAEACAGANIVVGGELPPEGSSDVLWLRLEASGGLVCRERQRPWAEDFIRFIELDVPLNDVVPGP